VEESCHKVVGGGVWLGKRRRRYDQGDVLAGCKADEEEEGGIDCGAEGTFLFRDGLLEFGCWLRCELRAEVPVLGRICRNWCRFIVDIRTWWLR
jgi:hypothetical protein